MNFAWWKHSWRRTFQGTTVAMCGGEALTSWTAERSCEGERRERRVTRSERW